jgi:hypothetical protein
MNGEIGGFGLIVGLTATSTYPVGLLIEQFADDADPFDIPDIDIAEIAMGLNGDMITWSKAKPILINLAVIPESNDDMNLSVLWNANRVGKSKQSALDMITLTGQYPSGAIVTLSTGKVLSGAGAPSINAAGRMKSKIFKFGFENITISRAGLTG